MQVILRTPEGVIRIYSKGADNIMRDRLDPSSRETQWPKCIDHLHVFAKDGLRTLVLAQKDISEEEYDAWKKDYDTAELAADNRDDKMEAVADRMERGFHLVGITAIDDKLQTGVPDAIFNLKRGGIKVWVLTGDKQETAINIGTSCRLLGPEMEPLIIINGHDFATVREQIVRYATEIGREAQNPKHRPFGLVIDGPSLVHVIMPEKKEIEKATVKLDNGVVTKKWTAELLAVQLDVEKSFVEIASHCSAVVCCRVSPLQKAQIVNLIKKHKKAVTLAIGDGANDVSMIKAAHVGIGISGHEGRQAVLASDYSIAQFRFLQRLLLVHGRWSYLRMCLFLRYFFYKNFAFTVAHFWFGIFNGWSAQASRLFTECISFDCTAAAVRRCLHLDLQRCVHVFARACCGHLRAGCL
jgi:magnesium-transporting ATPase (P-type)